MHLNSNAVLSSAGLFALGAVRFAAAETVAVNFDDLPTPNTASNIASWGLVPDEYAGPDWSGFEVVNGVSFQSVYQTTLAFPSMPNAAYNGGDGNLVVTVTGSAPFTFDGAWFTGWPGVGSYGASSVTIAGFLHGVQVGQPVVVQFTGAFVWTPVNLAGVNEVTLTSSGAAQYWLMDNFQYDPPVPEPATLAFAGLGLMALGVAGRRLRD